MVMHLIVDVIFGIQHLCNILDFLSKQHIHPYISQAV